MQKKRQNTGERAELSERKEVMIGAPKLNEWMGWPSPPATTKF